MRRSVTTQSLRTFLLPLSLNQTSLIIAPTTFSRANSTLQSTRSGALARSASRRATENGNRSTEFSLSNGRLTPRLRFSTDKPKLLLEPRKSSWMPQIWPSNEYVSHETQALSRLLERAQKFHRTLYASLGLLLGGSIIILYNWDTVKQRMGQEGAEVLREGIKSEDLQISATDFSKVLLNEILNDEKLISEVSRWLMQLLAESKSELSVLVVKVLQSEPVLEEVRRVADSVVRHLCTQPWVQEYVGQLLVAAISTEYSRNCAAQWAADLLYRDEVTSMIQQIVNQSVLREPTLRDEATKLASTIVADVLNDPQTIQRSQDHISAVLNAPEFQDYACGAAWNVVKKTFSPRWLSAQQTTSQSIPSSVQSTSQLHEAQFEDSGSSTTPATNSTTPLTTASRAVASTESTADTQSVSTPATTPIENITPVVVTSPIPSDDIPTDNDVAAVLPESEMGKQQSTPSEDADGCVVLQGNDLNAENMNCTSDGENAILSDFIQLDVSNQSNDSTGALLPNGGVQEHHKLGGDLGCVDFGGVEVVQMKDGEIVRRNDNTDYKDTEILSAVEKTKDVTGSSLEGRELGNVETMDGGDDKLDGFPTSTSPISDFTGFRSILVT